MIDRLTYALAPVHLVRLARWLLPVAGLMIFATYVWVGPTMPWVGVLAYFSSLLLLAAVPRMRACDHLAIAVIIFTVAEFAVLEPGGLFALTRWLVEMAAIGAALAPMKMVRMRAMAQLKPYRRFSESERRNSQRSRSQQTARPREPSRIALPVSRQVTSDSTD